MKLTKYLILLCCLFPTLVLARGETPVSQGLQYLTDAITGKTGLMLSTVAIMVVGLLCLGHFLRWMHLVYTIVGISIIFGASSIAEAIQGFIH